MKASSRRSARVTRTLDLLETLESRTLLSATALTPAEIRQAYGFDQINGDGRGQTIAIVDVGSTPTVMADLDVFDSAFSLNGSISLYSEYGAAPTFLKVHPMKSKLRPDVDWSQETALDVEWAHAVAPGAKILLVQAASASFTDLLAAVNYARNQSEVSVVSMSWGGSEWSGEKNFDNNFTTPRNHQGITFVASTGDDGGLTSYPATSPNVLAVGGTTLHTSGGSYQGEMAWSDTGGGTSFGESAPVWQGSFTGLNVRSSPDVAYDADPNTGVMVYDSYQSPGWMVFGGTSAGAPQWSGLVAIANQLRVEGGQGTLDGANQLLPAIYSAPAEDFHDVTWGSAGEFTAGEGYDLTTGRGSPVANLLIPTLAGVTTGVSSKPTKPPKKPRRQSAAHHHGIVSSTLNLAQWEHGAVSAARWAL
jgi:subtilase family serine protease